jgi:hypothetical protein
MPAAAIGPCRDGRPPQHAGASPVPASCLVAEMTEHLYPHSVADLELAPVLISIERNLAVARDATDLEFTLALELNDDDSIYHSPTERARRVQRFATRGVSLHGWNVYPSADRHGLAVWHGDFTVTLALGEQLTDYVQNGRPR